MYHKCVEHLGTIIAPVPYCWIIRLLIEEE
jgi:hypothetical protein